MKTEGIFPWKIFRRFWKISRVIFKKWNYVKIKISKKPTLRDFQNYAREMVKERGFENETVLEQCLLLGEEVGELFKAVRKQ